MLWGFDMVAVLSLELFGGSFALSIELPAWFLLAVSLPALGGLLYSFGQDAAKALSKAFEVKEQKGSQPPSVEQSWHGLAHLLAALAAEGKKQRFACADAGPTSSHVFPNLQGEAEVGTAMGFGAEPAQYVAPLTPQGDCATSAAEGEKRQVARAAAGSASSHVPPNLQGEWLALDGHLGVLSAEAMLLQQQSVPLPEDGASIPLTLQCLQAECGTAMVTFAEPARSAAPLNPQGGCGALDGPPLHVLARNIKLPAQLGESLIEVQPQQQQSVSGLVATAEGDATPSHTLQPCDKVPEEVQHQAPFGPPSGDFWLCIKPSCRLLNSRGRAKCRGCYIPLRMHSLIEHMIREASLKGEDMGEWGDPGA